MLCVNPDWGDVFRMRERVLEQGAAERRMARRRRTLAERVPCNRRGARPVTERMGQEHSRVAVRARGASVPGIEDVPPSMVGRMPSVPAILCSGPAAHADSGKALGTSITTLMPIRPISLH